jgi:hypothetical protein
MMHLKWVPALARAWQFKSPQFCTKLDAFNDLFEPCLRFICRRRGPRRVTARNPDREILIAASPFRGNDFAPRALAQRGESFPKPSLASQ